MGFDISIVSEVLKFPHPLFPRYKHVFPYGVRFEIPETLNVSKTYEFEITLPTESKFELQSFVYSATGYTDKDNYSLKVGEDFILKNIYTKELGQVKEIRPIVKIDPTLMNFKFIFNNVSGTSKVIWLDLDLTSSKPIRV